MTLPASPISVSYVGTGFVSLYSYTFKTWVSSDLRVIQADTTGAETVLTLNVDYTVTGAGSASGGTITLTTALPLNYTLLIRRYVPFVQATDLRNGSSPYLATIEDALDYVTALIQQVNANEIRSVQFTETAALAGVSVALPAPSANAVLAWNAAGTALINLATGSVTLAVPADGSVTLAKMAPALALSVIGNGTNGVATPTALTAAADGTVLRRSGTSVGFGTVTATTALTQPTATVLGRGTAATGATEALVLTGLTAGPSTLTNDAQFNGFKNKLINGSFDVWQRGTSFNTTATYTADRWRMAFTGTAPTLSRQTRTLGALARPGQYFLRLVNAAGTTTSTVVQRIEGVSTFAGDNICISLTGKAGAARALAISVTQNFGTGGAPSVSVTTAVGNINLTTSIARSSVTVPVPSITGKTLGTAGNDYLEVTITFPVSTSETYDIYDVQAERGITMTDLEQIPPWATMEACQRYYCKTFPAGVTPAFAAGLTGALALTQVVGASTAQFGMTWRFPVRMCSPTSSTIITYNPITAANIQPRGAAADWSAIALGTVNDTSVIFNATSPAATAAGAPMYIHITVEQEL